MKLHITLVNPAAPVGAAMHMPFALLGLGYLAAVLEKNNYKVDVIDCQILNMSLEEFKREISKRQPDILGVTSSTLTYQTGLKLLKISKEVCPNCITVAGGAHVTFWDDHALEECPELDVVIRKEGENTMLEIVQRIEAGKGYQDILGITCRVDGKIVRNPDRPYIEDLDSLPFPARHLWPMERFRELEDILYLATSRGCIYWCEFCTTVRMHGRKYRMRSPKNVVDELEELYQKYGIKKFTFCDDAFTVDQSRIEDLCNEILKRGLKIEWNCGTRVDMITKELLSKMKEAGCISVWFGVESGTQQVLDAMKKGITPELTVRVLSWVRELGLKPVPNVILGFPGETKKVLGKQSNLLKNRP
jgi:anaerobic magnesium-protoporphyrin IX monomethyl ester cyclase